MESSVELEFTQRIGIFRVYGNWEFILMCGEGGGESPVLVFLYLLFIFKRLKYILLRV